MSALCTYAQCIQPLCVMSSKGGGRAGCMCTLVCAYQMMNDPSPEPECWEQDQNIIDQVWRV